MADTATQSLMPPPAVPAPLYYADLDLLLTFEEMDEIELWLNFPERTTVVRLPAPAVSQTSIDRFRDAKTKAILEAIDLTNDQTRLKNVFDQAVRELSLDWMEAQDYLTLERSARVLRKLTDRVQLDDDYEAQRAALLIRLAQNKAEQKRLLDEWKQPGRYDMRKNGSNSVSQ